MKNTRSLKIIIAVLVVCFVMAIFAGFLYVRKDTADMRPIGVYDSGMGGLIVLETLIEEFPNEDFIFIADPDKYSGDDIVYIKKVLNSMSIRTIWRGFYSTNNYSMPAYPVRTGAHVEYWYGEHEKSARKCDMEYVSNMFPGVVFRENKGQDHAETFTLHPEEFCESIRSVAKKLSFA